VALGTRHRRVCAGQREHRRVVEARWAPAAGGVAEGTVRRESRRNVIWAGCSRKVCVVARVTRGRSIGVVVVRVALHAGQRGMHSS